MKQILAYVMILIINQVYAQPGKTVYEATSILKKVVVKLNSFSRVSYRYTHETRYYENNYHYVSNANIYFEYIKNSPIGLRFQAVEEKAMFVYDGGMTLRMNKNDMTIDSASTKTAKEMENNSYLYHSLAMLRNILPLAISNDTIQKSVSDTIIGRHYFFCIKIEAPKMYFGLFNGIKHIQSSDLRRPYYLLVDKNNFLPYQFVSKYIRGNDDRDFVRVTFTGINTRPKAPAILSWKYDTYADKYQPFHPAERKPIVKTGTVVADFTLPDYTPGLIDSVSLRQYKGKVVLLDFWFKSCGPCMEAMPHYNALQNKFGKEHFQLLTINIEDEQDDMKYFFNKYQPTYKMLFNGGQLFERLGLAGCPSSVLLDKSGKVVHVFEGFDQMAIEKKIEATMIQN